MDHALRARRQTWMLVSLLTLTSLVLAWRPSSADDPLVKVAGPLANQASKRDAGSAGIFRGRVVIAEIFLEDPESGWSVAEREEINRRMEAAMAFLEQQAERFNQPLEFARIDPKILRWDQMLPTDSTTHPSWTSQVIQAATGESADAWIQNLKTTHSAAASLICLHVDKASLSYNLAYYAHIAPEYYAERMICFSRYPDGRPTADATYAHELLHLFGAGDLYFPYDTDSARKRAARVQFPNDVMLRVDYDLKALDVGEFTAFRVGWRDQLEVTLRHFED